MTTTAASVPVTEATRARRNPSPLAPTGGNRGLWALRIPLEHLGARVYPDMFSLARAHLAFDANGEIGDAELQARLERNIMAFMDLVEASKHYPCVKTKWVEYLAEHPDPVIDRVE
jgi:chromate reductase, NAD(P)H dehydrogenase (quinone)